MEVSKKFYIQWHFLERCNLRCIHCYQSSYHKKEMSLSDIMKIAKHLDLVMEKWKRKGRISLTGGEPFLREDILFTLLEFFEKSPNYYWVGILTNGTLLNEKNIEILNKFKKLKEIQISLDGASSETHDKIRGKGCFEKVINAISLLKKKGCYTTIMFTLHRKNQEEALKIIDLAVKMEIDAITIERITPFDEYSRRKLLMSKEELLDIYKKIYNKKLNIEKRKIPLKIRVSRPLWVLFDDRIGGFCPIGYTSIALLHDGTVFPCRRLPIKLGNILTDGLFKIWYTSEVLWEIRNKSLLANECKNCKFLSKCGGCRAIAYAITGNCLEKDPQCFKELLEKGEDLNVK